MPHEHVEDKNQRSKLKKEINTLNQTVVLPHIDATEMFSEGGSGNEQLK